MSNRGKTDRWLRLFEAQKQVFASQRLEKSVQFLYRARAAGQGWGAYPLLPADLHHSALAVEALYLSGDQAADLVISDVAVCMRQAKGESLGDLTPRDLADFLMILACEKSPDEDYARDVRERIERVFDKPESNDGDVRFQAVCAALAVPVGSSKWPTPFLTRWTSWLTNLQRPDGSWPAAPGESGSVVTTAVAVLALNPWSRIAGKEPLARGIRFLRKYLEGEQSWEKIAAEGGTFGVAVVLRAVAEVPEAPYPVVQGGVDLLLSRMNPDYGWGGGMGEASNVECAALSLSALAATGENRFVPKGLAEAAFRDVKQTVLQLAEERNQLQRDFDRRVQEQCGKLLEDRDRLRDENKGLKDQVKEMEVATQEEIGRNKARVELLRKNLEREYELVVGSELKRSVYRTYQLAVIGFLAVVATYATFKLWGWPPSPWKLGLIALLAAAGSGMVWYWARRGRRYGAFPSLEVSGHGEVLTDETLAMRRDFLSLAERWPPSLREEFVYRLFRDLVDMPPNIAHRYIEDMMERVRLPEFEKKELRMWVGNVMRLHPVERRVLFEQLRDAVLR